MNHLSVTGRRSKKNPQEKSWANISSQSQLGCWVSIHRNQVPASFSFHYSCSFNYCDSYLHWNEIGKHAWILSLSQEGEGNKIPKRRVEQTSLLKASWVVELLSTEIKSPHYAVSTTAAFPTYAVTKLGSMRESTLCHTKVKKKRSPWGELSKHLNSISDGL